MKVRSVFGALPVLVLSLLVAGCGGGGENGDSAEGGNGGEAQPVVAKAREAGLSVPPAMLAFDDDGNVYEITIEGTDQMTYNLDHFEVEAGQMVRLTLEHVGSMPAALMGHNVVIIEQGEDPVAFGGEANDPDDPANQDNDYLPDSVRDRVIAYTELIGGGESSTVEFQAPDEPGEYPFVCTFQGHAGQMNGTMEVTE